MKIAITLENNNGLDSLLSMHFGQCSYFYIADIENNQVKNAKVIQNQGQHGRGCAAVYELVDQNVTHLIAGGMGQGALQKCAEAGMKVFSGSGTVKEALDAFIKGNLEDVDACLSHAGCEEHHQ